MAADAGHPPGHPHLGSGPRVRTEVGVALLELRGHVGPVEAQRVRIQAAVAQSVALGPPLLYERVTGGLALGSGLALGTLCHLTLET